MKRYSGLFVMSVVFALLSGCATMGRITGFSPQVRESFDVQEPWQNLVVRGYVSEMHEIASTYIPLPQPLPRKLEKEFVYVRRAGEEKRSLERWSFRTLFYREESFIGMYDAVLDPSRKGFRLLLPLNGNGKQSIFRYVGSDLHLVILSSNSSWIMTTKGEIVDLPKDVSLMELPAGFFKKHPSRMPEVIIVRRNNLSAENFFSGEDGLENRFPRQLVFHGKKYSGRWDAQSKYNEFTSEKHVLDRLTSCGSLTGSLAWAHPIGLALSAGPQAVHDVRVVMKENCDE